jgi:cytosine/adenosine deaminase-related metal-dependent hydrolase
MANTLGRIVPGFAADLVFVRCDEVTYVPAGDALMQFVFAESGAGIDRVMVGGRSIVVDGKMTTLDEDRLYAAAQQAAETLATSLAPTRERQAQLARYVMDFCRGRYPGDVR